MDKEKILEAMAHIDPALVEEADRPAVRRRAGWSRPALIAACLCLLLAGTAMAAAGVSRMRVTRVFDSEKSLAKYGYEDSYSGYEIVGGMACVPADALSEEINQLVFASPRETICKLVSGWNAAEEFLGRNLLDNPVLDKAPSARRYMDGTEMGMCMITAGANDKGLTAVHVGTSYLFGEITGGKERVEVEVEADLYTDLYAEMKAGQSEEEMSLEKKLFPAGAVTGQEDYITPDGLETVIFRIQPDAYSACFSLNGVRFGITASHSTDSAFALETLKTVLDACTVES